MFFKKQTAVRFFNVVPGVEIAHPITLAKHQRYDWMTKAALDFKERDRNQKVPEKITGVNRCPGITGYLKTGFIVTAPFDFSIMTHEDDRVNFRWDASANIKEVNFEYISGLGKNFMASFLPFRNDTLETLIKVNTGWRCVLPKDIALLQLPIPYPDHNVFTACSGLIDPDKYLELNVQLQWHHLDGVHTVKAGTPLCQLVPVPKELVLDLVVNKMTDKDEYLCRAHKYVITHNYKRDLVTWKNSVKSILDKLRRNNNA
jgi:hypothetical protein